MSTWVWEEGPLTRRLCRLCQGGWAEEQQPAVRRAGLPPAAPSATPAAAIKTLQLREAVPVARPQVKPGVLPVPIDGVRWGDANWRKWGRVKADIHSPYPTTTPPGLLPAMGCVTPRIL